MTLKELANTCRSKLYMKSRVWNIETTWLSNLYDK